MHVSLNGRHLSTLPPLLAKMNQGSYSLTRGNLSSEQKTSLKGEAPLVGDFFPSVPSLPSPQGQWVGCGSEP